MFNNCKHIRSKPNYTRVAALDSAFDMCYDGTRLIVGSAYNGTSTTNLANYISTIDSNYNVYKHVAGGVSGNYLHHRTSIFNGTLFTQAMFNTATTGVLNAIHKWDASYNWVSNDVITAESGITASGLLKGTNYLWAAMFSSSTDNYVVSYDSTGTKITSNRFATVKCFNIASQGLACYNNTRHYCVLQIAGVNYVGYLTISGSSISAYNVITITEAPGAVWAGGVVLNNKALFLDNLGKVVIVDCATNTYTYLGTILPAVSLRYLLCPIDDYIYIDIYEGSNVFYRFNILTNELVYFTKFNNSSIISYCKGFGDYIFATERDNITKQHYLLKLDV